jgi:hypothetical protein
MVASGWSVAARAQTDEPTAPYETASASPAPTPPPSGTPTPMMPTPTPTPLRCPDDQILWGAVGKCSYDAHFTYNVTASCENVEVVRLEDGTTTSGGVRVTCGGTIGVTFDNPMLNELKTTSGDVCAMPIVGTGDQPPSFETLLCGTMGPTTHDLSLLLPISLPDVTTCNTFAEGQSPESVCKNQILQSYAVELPVVGVVYRAFRWPISTLCCVEPDYATPAP